jgi:DNA helicase TIP49 (TBP-interacting protein)
MTESKQQALSEIVQISRQYQRSIRVDADIGRADALTGYICHGTAASVVEGMCKQISSTNQRCFTWTGPFGGGKSSLAVALASALRTDCARAVVPTNVLKSTLSTRANSAAAASGA